MKQNVGWRRTVIRLALACLAGVILFAVARPVSAAFILKYFTATTVNNQLLLEWETVSEYNISGFEIFCKEEYQLDDQYHPIGTRAAVGSLDSGVAYNFLVQSGLEAGLTYCFRLREITTDGSPSEYSDICGYGINIDPNMATSTITPTVEVGLIAATPTVVQVYLATPIVGEGTPLTIDSLDSSVITGSISIAGSSPLPTPMATMVTPLSETPLPPAAPESPLPAPLGDSVVPSPPPVAVDGAGSAANDANNSPLPSPTVAAATGERVANPAMSDANTSPLEPPTVTPRPIPTFTPAPTSTPVPTMTPVAAAARSIVLADTEPALNDQNVDTLGLNAPAQATPSYIVVTATATPLNETPVTTFTPYPTALPASEEGLFALANPTVENLILLTLCFIFLGAGGIGMLGLTATMLYIRSRREPQSSFQIDQFDIDGYGSSGRIDRQLDQIDQFDQGDDWLR